MYLRVLIGFKRVMRPKAAPVYRGLVRHTFDAANAKPQLHLLCYSVYTEQGEWLCSDKRSN